MYLPWVVGVCLDLLEGKGRRRAALLALAVGLQVLRGHVQILYYTLLCVGVLRAGQVDRRCWRRAAGASPARALALAADRRDRRRPGGGLPGRRRPAAAGARVRRMVGARVAPRAGARATSTPPAGACTRGSSRPWSSRRPPASGWAPTRASCRSPTTPTTSAGCWLTLRGASAVWAAPRWPQRTLAALALLVAADRLRRLFPVLYGPFYHLLPYFNKFRIPVMILVVTRFATAVLAAHGVAALAGADAGARARAAGCRWSWLGSAPPSSPRRPGLGAEASQENLAGLARSAGAAGAGAAAGGLEPAPGRPAAHRLAAGRRRRRCSRPAARHLRRRRAGLDAGRAAGARPAGGGAADHPSRARAACRSRATGQLAARDGARSRATGRGRPPGGSRSPRCCGRRSATTASGRFDPSRRPTAG